MTDTLAIPGLLIRGWRGMDDIPGMSAVANSARAAAGSGDITTADDMRNDYQHLIRCDPDRDIWVVEADGSTVAYARAWWADRNEGGRGFEAISFVEPAWVDRGIEDALLAVAEERQLALAASMRDDIGDGGAYLVRYVEGRRPAEVARLDRAGFHLARRWAEMRRQDLADIPVIPVPVGIDLRRLEGDDATDPTVWRRWWDMGTEAFAEHYGESRPGEQDWLQFLEWPRLDATLWCLAVDAGTGEPVGHILNYLGDPAPDGTVIGWTESIAVRRGWRRRGLASAMLAESLRIVRDAGASQAALGVDAQNPNQAMTLYERLGFRVITETLEYQRPISPTEGAA